MPRMSRKSGGALFWVFLLILVLAGAGAGYWYWRKAENTAPEYRTAAIEKGDLTQAVTATGQMNPVTNVQVGCQISGMLSEIKVDFNSPVKKGQIVARIDPSTYLATVHQAEGDLANAKAAVELAKVDAARSTALLKDQLVAQSDDDKAEADLHQAQAQVIMKQAALERAQIDLDRCIITAPVDGVVISRNVDVGQTVAASLSAPTLFLIANDLTKMQIDANVSEADVGGVEENQVVDFSVDAFPYRTFHGKITQVRFSPITVQNVVSYDTVVAVNNDDMKLKPGMTANISIIVSHHTNVIKMANAALRFHPPEVAGKKSLETNLLATTVAPTNQAPAATPGAKHGAGGKRDRTQHLAIRTVYLLTDAEKGTIKPVQIKTGITDGAFTEVTEGLKEGDVIITGVNGAEANKPAALSNPLGGGGGGGRMGR